MIDERSNAARRAWLARLPKWPITLRKGKRLLEYSGSYPTGTTPGKVWRRHDGAHDPGFHLAGGKPTLLICQYDPAAPKDEDLPEGHRGTIAIHYYRPLIRVPAGRRVVPATIIHRHTNININGGADDGRD